MKVIGFAGSNSKNSINKKFVNYTLNLIDSYETELLDLNDFDIPIFSVDREEDNGYPEKVIDFVKKIQSADALVVSLAEHNGAYTTVFKNLMDWCSRYELKFFKKTPMLLLSTSPGGNGGGNVMELALSRLPKFDADIVSHFSLPKFDDNFNDTEGVIDDSLGEKFFIEFDKFRATLQ
ncbi:MAG: NAD(P)H-dependent oxidoreductase [Brumimicrobium sp.]